ncbi:MAG: DUF128 domain-containing protein, partial [Candidatus Abyssubacteria bacterium]|nr:DUF128 domain-containing protein [Candidatus Abyssubacteria bacterium]
MSEKTEKKRLAILRVLHEGGKPMGSSKIAERLLAAGHEISERTVRFYLKEMDREDLTENLGRKGRLITQRGLQELGSARIIEKIGFLAAKIDQMTYRMSFNLSTRSGTVVVNVSVVDKSELAEAAPLVKKVFVAGYAMGRLVTLFPPGERIGDVTIPEGMIGLGTVCS